MGGWTPVVVVLAVGSLVIALGVWDFVVLRKAAATRRGEDVRAARRSALWQGIPVATAAILGLVAFVAGVIMAVIGFTFESIDNSFRSESEHVDRHLEGFVILGTALLIALPLLAVAVVVGVKHLRRR